MMKLYLYLLLDESGSMQDRRSMVVNGYNEFIQKQQRVGGEEECLVSIFFFNDTVRELCNNVPLKDVEPLKNEDYNPVSTTALLDAMDHVLTRIRDTPPSEEGVEVRHMLLVMTDGEENASTRMTQNRLRQLLDTTPVEVVYMGSNQDAILNGAGMGANRDSSLAYDDMFMIEAIDSLGNAVGRVRSGETRNIVFTPQERARSGGGRGLGGRGYGRGLGGIDFFSQEHSQDSQGSTDTLLL